MRRIAYPHATLAMMAAHSMALRELSGPLVIEEPPALPEPKVQPAAVYRARYTDDTAFREAALSAAEAKRARKNEARRAALEKGSRHDG